MMKGCPLRFDTPAEILADWLHERGWTFEDLETRLAAFLDAGGWEHLPEALPCEEDDSDGWEMVADPGRFPLPWSIAPRTPPPP
jgi:hypothetical protein